MSEVETPPPDIMVRKRNHKIYLGPESHRGEEWMINHLPARPLPEDNLDTGVRVGCRSFIVSAAELDEIFKKAKGDNLIIRKESH
jgi:hypothetical protein